MVKVLNNRFQSVFTDEDDTNIAAFQSQPEIETTISGIGSVSSELVLTYLTLAGTGHFAFFHGTRGGGGLVRPPLAVSPLIELELGGKNERVARRETKRLIYKLKVLGQPVTSEVRSSAEK